MLKKLPDLEARFIASHPFCYTALIMASAGLIAIVGAILTKMYGPPGEFNQFAFKFLSFMIALAWYVRGKVRLWRVITGRKEDPTKVGLDALRKSLGKKDDKRKPLAP